MKKKKKGTLTKEESACKGCPSYCCHDLAMIITRPESKKDIDELRWYLHYDTVNLFIRSHRWHILVKGKCIYLDDNNLCRIYDKRNRICRGHKPPDCERYGSYHDHVIKTPTELDEYLHRKSIKPRLLPKRQAKKKSKMKTS